MDASGTLRNKSRKKRKVGTLRRGPQFSSLRVGRGGRFDGFGLLGGHPHGDVRQEHDRTDDRRHEAAGEHPAPVHNARDECDLEDQHAQTQILPSLGKPERRLYVLELRRGVHHIVGRESHAVGDGVSDGSRRQDGHDRVGRTHDASADRDDQRESQVEQANEQHGVRGHVVLVLLPEPGRHVLLAGEGVQGQRGSEESRLNDEDHRHDQQSQCDVGSGLAEHGLGDGHEGRVSR